MIDMKQTMPFIVMIAVLVIVAVIVIHLMNYRLKKRILEQGTNDETTLKILRELMGSDMDILKWGLILLFGGLGLIVLPYLPYNAGDSPLPYGVEIVFLATGFLLYYFILKNDQKPH